MALDIRIKIDAKALLAELDDLAKRQLPFAMSRAATAIAKEAVTDLQAEMKSVFSDPSTFTLNAFYAKPATRSDPTAYVASRDSAPKGRAAIKYLAPEIFGGPRRMKGFELLLTDKTGGQFTVPGSNYVVTRGALTRLLSRLEALRDPTQNLSDRTTKRLHRKRLTVKVSNFRSDYFIGHDKLNGRPNGIYRLVGSGKIERVLALVPNAPDYTVRLPVETIVQSTVNRTAQRELRKALDAAIATARR